MFSSRFVQKYYTLMKCFFDLFSDDPESDCGKVPYKVDNLFYERFGMSSQEVWDSLDAGAKDGRGIIV